MTARDLFKIRAVYSNWADYIKGSWCEIVKNEMLEQVQSLDLLYKKEETASQIELKSKYLVSFATLM